MSRTRRVGPVEGFWTTVDEWAAEVVDPIRARSWWNSSCRLVARGGAFLDVVDEDADLDLRFRPVRDPIGARGTAAPDTPELRAALAEGDVEHRRVLTGRRYRWSGPALTPVVLELHTTEDEAVLEAWWEDVWAAWPTITLGRESGDRRPPRRASASAQVNRLFKALALDPLGRLPD